MIEWLFGFIMSFFLFFGVSAYGPTEPTITEPITTQPTITEPPEVFDEFNQPNIDDLPGPDPDLVENICEFQPVECSPRVTIEPWLLTPPESAPPESEGN